MELENTRHSAITLPGNIPERLRSAIDWYGTRASRVMRVWTSLKAIQIIAAVAIPVGAVILPEVAIRGVTAILGALVSGIETYLQLRQHQSNWLRWRTAQNSLQREAWLYGQQAGRYSDTSAPQQVLLAEIVEKIIAEEHASWASANRGAIGDSKLQGAFSRRGDGSQIKK
jgi:hypothetical protein